MKTFALTCFAVAAVFFRAGTTSSRAEEKSSLSRAELEANARRLTEEHAAEDREEGKKQEVVKALTGKWQGQLEKNGAPLTVVFNDNVYNPTMQVTEPGKPASPPIPYAIVTRANDKPGKKKIGVYSPDQVVVIHRGVSDHAPELRWRIMSLESDSLEIVVESRESKGLKASLKRVP